MPRIKPKNKVDLFARMAGALDSKLKPPFGIVLGSPVEVAEIAAALPHGEITCYQMDLYQAARLEAELRERGVGGVDVRATADLWDLLPDFQTLLYPVAYAGERALKLDMVEQAFHVLKPGGTFIVLSPYDNDQFFPQTLKKIFHKVHTPMEGENAVFWCQRQGQRPKRRHEIEYQVRADEATSFRFLSRPGVFSYGKLDDGARALVEAANIEPGMRVVDLGCGLGAVGILAGHKAGPEGFVAFVDSNTRATALTELNVQSAGLKHHQTFTTRDVVGPDERSFDVVLANPPYYANNSIAQLFIERGHALLKPGGTFYLVTKQIDQIYPLVQQRFGDPEMGELRGYIIFEVKK